MNKRGLVIIGIAILTFNAISANAQIKVRVAGGLIYINNGDFSSLKKPDERKYIGITDSLDKNLKINPNDTTSLFYRALLYLAFNDIHAKPYSKNDGALANLTVAKGMVEKAVSLKMQNINLKLLQAEIYSALTYRFSGDESWMFKGNQIAERRALFNNYKALANKYYDDLSVMDKNNSFEYQRLKINYDYPIR